MFMPCIYATEHGMLLAFTLHGVLFMPCIYATEHGIRLAFTLPGVYVVLIAAVSLIGRSFTFVCCSCASSVVGPLVFRNVSAVPKHVGS